MCKPAQPMAADPKNSYCFGKESGRRILPWAAVSLWWW